MVNSMSFNFLSLSPEGPALMCWTLRFMEGYYVYSGKVSHVLSGVLASLALSDDSQDGRAAQRC